MEPFVVAYGGRSAFPSASRPPLSTRDAPFLRSIRPYSGERLRTDAIAGVTVAALALPAAMAYAGIAGVPITAGLYGLLLPVLAYAVFGTAPRLVVGPEGTVSLLVASSLAPLAATGSTEYAMLAAALAILVALCTSPLASSAWAGSPITSRRPCSSATSAAWPSC